MAQVFVSKSGSNIGCHVAQIFIDIHNFAIAGAPDTWVLIFCVFSTLLWARVAARFANKADAATLNRATGIILVILGVVIMGVRLIQLW